MTNIERWIERIKNDRDFAYNELYKTTFESCEKYCPAFEFCMKSDMEGCLNIIKTWGEKQED